MGKHPDSYRNTKSITDAPNLRDAMVQMCSNCAFYQMVAGTGDGVCTKHEFQPASYYVCDDYEALPPATEGLADAVEAIVEAVAEMPTENMMSAYGSEIKSLGDGHIGGYLVRFGSPTQTDMDGDYFDATTDFGFGKGEEISTPVWMNHCQPMRTGTGKAVAMRDPIGQGTIKMVEDGIVIDAILFEREKYEQYLSALGWSSGTAGHTWKSVPKGKSAHITRWHLGLDASLTPKPADPRNAVLAIKSLQNIPLTANPEAEPKATVLTAAAQATVTASEKTNLTQSAVKSAKEQKDMEAELQTILDAVNETTSNVKSFTTRLDAVEKALKAEPPTNTSGGTNITVISDPADRPFKSIAAQLLAVKHYTLTKQDSDYPRLRGLKALEMANLKATGASEAIPGDGGFLLEPTLSQEILAPMHEVGQFTAGVRRMPVSTNSNSGTIPGVDETSRVDGSRWGGIRGYWLAEGGTKVASRPTFREIAWKLKKIAVLSVATDELLQDAPMYSAFLRQGAGEELMFRVNDAVFEGLGVSTPLGITNSPALITVTRTTGSKILGEDISAMWNRLDPRSRNNATWYIGNDSQPQLDNLFAVGSTAVLYPYASIQNGIQTLYGRPVVVTEYNQSLNTTGDILLADMSQYFLWEKGDPQEDTSIHVYFTTDETAFRFVYRVDGMPAVASAVTPFHGSTTTSPFVVLGSAT